jgi:SAM-dependent methyltransferase
MGNPHDKSLFRCDAELFLLGAFILFAELLLIRWIGTEIRVFAYLGNLVLVVCFFGTGLGCYLGSRPVSMVRLGVNLLLLVTLIANPLHLEALNIHNTSYVLSGFEDSPLWLVGFQLTTIQVLSGLIVVAVLTYLVAFTFVPAGQLLGRGLQKHPRTIRAYSANIFGSLAGIWLFNALSWASFTPTTWFAVATGLVAALALVGQQPGSWTAVVLAALTPLVVWLGQQPAWRTVWSPYHRLTLQVSYADPGTNRVAQGYVMDVNGTFYQQILNLSDDFVHAHADILDPYLVARSHYNLPFCFKPVVRRMLIVGAGSGNDAAAALRHGAGQIDCVEIDPQIYALGKELHPEHPYDSPRVHMMLNDARAYFKQATDTYDVIWFGWLDSHTLGSSYNNLRLDHYVYTRESLEEARRLLAPDGVVILSFGAERSWIADRLATMLRQVFGHDPLVYSVDEIPRQCGGGNLTLVCGNKPLRLDDVADPSLREFIRAHEVHLPGTTRVTTDDWPYLYLQHAKIPKLHLLVTLAIPAGFLLARRRVLDLNLQLDWHFFALGAAFLLLEVQTVSRATLLFGMTWVVNAIVISAVLVMILLSNLVAWRWPRLPQGVIITGLALTVAVLAFVPLDWFNALTGPTKLLTVSAFLTAPVFFAGLVFIQSFATCTDKTRALGSNLIGALVGGLLESLSFVTGIRALVVLVGLFYLVAILRRPAAVRR